LEGKHTTRNNTSIASDLALTTTTLNRKEEVVKLPTTQFPNTIESLATNAQLPPIKIQSDSIRKYINGENTISTLDSFPLNPSNRSNAGFGYTINTDERKWQEKTKTFQKEFDLSANGSSKIINEFGKVQIKPWKLNKAKIKVTVSVSGHKPAKIQQVFEHLNIHFSQQGEQIIAKTEVRNRKKISWNNRKNWKVRIDYEVYIPERSSI